MGKLKDQLAGIAALVAAIVAIVECWLSFSLIPK